jgi:hypothetical protein
VCARRAFSSSWKGYVLPVLPDKSGMVKNVPMIPVVGLGMCGIRRKSAVLRSNNYVVIIVGGMGMNVYVWISITLLMVGVRFVALVLVMMVCSVLLL